MESLNNQTKKIITTGPDKEVQQHQQNMFNYEASSSSDQQVNFELNENEYGLSSANQIDVHFQPSEYGILDNYSVLKEIYKVQLSPTIISLTAHKETNQRVIKKSIIKDKLINDVQIGYARQECIIHSQLKNPNIVELYDYTENEKEIVLLMEFCNDANYFEEKIENSLTPITNQQKLQAYANDILQGLYYIHNLGVIHSDLKIQNALLQRPEEELAEAGELPMVKLCDFGLSHVMSMEYGGKALMVERCGTGGYIAPEIGAKNTIVGPEIDMWSFGVMLYEMCTAYKPTKLLNYRYGSGPIPFRDRDWKKHNKYIKDLIMCCLEISPEKRISSYEALQHPWFYEEV